MTSATNLAKVHVLTDGRLESLWAEPAGRNLYRIRNEPALAWGLSFDDVISVKARGGQLYFDRVVERGGHSTYRLMLSEGVSWEAFQEAWAPSRAIGCTFEAFTHRYVGIDVPPTTDIHEAYRLLEAGMAAGLWTFDEVHVGHPLESRPKTPGGWRSALRRLSGSRDLRER